jgi:uncharacterized protein
VHGTRGIKTAAIAATAILGVTLLAAAATIYVTAGVARAVVTPVRKRKQDQAVVDFDDSTREVTLTDTPDAAVGGRYGLWFANDSGYARIGDVVDRRHGTVTRVVDDVLFGDIGSARSARLSGWYYLEPEDLGYPVSSVSIATSLGEAPAWLIQAEEDTGKWVIQVHGRGAERQEALRAVSVFRESGYTSLIISYRNDGDAPESEDRRYGLGGTEWLDVEAGIRFALERGAQSIVLMGWSMGGAIVLQTATRSPSLEKVHGIVLESPVIDWINTLDYQADLMKVPSPIAKGALRLIESPWGKPITGLEAAIDFTSMDFVTRALDLTLPTLILHSDDDGFVPSTASRALAASRPDIVTLVPFTEAKHTKLWNYDEVRWNSSIKTWLSQLVEQQSS